MIGNCGFFLGILSSIWPPTLIQIYASYPDISLHSFGGPVVVAGGLGQQATQIVRAEIGVAQDSSKSAFAQFLVKRHDQGDSMARLLETDMAAALTRDLPTFRFQRLDEALAGDDRLARAHAGRGILRRTTPMSSGSPSSRSPST